MATACHDITLKHNSKSLQTLGQANNHSIKQLDSKGHLKGGTTMRQRDIGGSSSAYCLGS